MTAAGYESQAQGTVGMSFDNEALDLIKAGVY